MGKYRLAQFTFTFIEIYSCRIYSSNSMLRLSSSKTTHGYSITCQRVMKCLKVRIYSCADLNILCNFIIPWMYSLKPIVYG